MIHGHQKGETMTINRETPFWDISLTNKERIDWLLSAMTIEEKLCCLSSQMRDIERLGIPAYHLGGEAAHGVEGRNDQNDYGEADITTSFPQPIGMSASWDTELIKLAGDVVGRESRATNKRHPQGGLSRWAPTVDLERDPRWGRTEEGYGEDPLLTGEMAGAYIKGIQGDNPKYIQAACTLKHFYGNNTENGRGWKNDTIDHRNLYEYYLEPFRRCIEDANTQGIMTAYNRINGTTGILNHEVQDILKDQYGLTHAVGDGGALSLVVSKQHRYGQLGEALAEALKAGVDAMSDDPALVESAAKEAYDLQLITEADCDRAIRNTMEVRLRLGVYDKEPSNPYDFVTEEDVDSLQNREICLALTRESVVLLKNDNDLLPLDKKIPAIDLALIGPFGDVWYEDWYGGVPPYRKTLRQGLSEITNEIPYADGLDRVILWHDGKGITITDDEKLILTEHPDVFIKENWGEGSYTFRSERTGKFLSMVIPDNKAGEDNLGDMVAKAETVFDWFVLEIFHFADTSGSLMEAADSSFTLQTRFHSTVCLDEAGYLAHKRKCEALTFNMEIVEDGIAKAAALAKGKKAVILALGCNPMINAKEEIDRLTLDLPPDQEKLIQAVTAECDNVILSLFTNYPYTITAAKEKVPAILTMATGSQDMGRAMAETIFGINAPAGRLNMTWYQDVRQLPSIDDYDIIQGERTYRYFKGDVLYPFGYGLTYTTFTYSDLTVTADNGSKIMVQFSITNIGKKTSDEVVQVYGKAPASRVKKPNRQLLAFKRIKDVEPGQTLPVSFCISTKEFRFYDCISSSLMIEDGLYEILIGTSCQDIAQKAVIQIPGRKTGVRNLEKRISADHYDTSENMQILEGHFNYRALSLNDPNKYGTLTYGDCLLTGKEKALSLHVKSIKGCTIEVYLNGTLTGSWEGDTLNYEYNSAFSFDALDYLEVPLRNLHREPNYEDILIALDKTIQAEGIFEITFKISGDAKVCFFKASQD
jgi:beta-glucosidase